MRIIERKEMITKNFAKQIFRKYENRVRDLILTTTQGEPIKYDFDKKELTEYGCEKVKKLCDSLISFEYDYGANIASQSVNQLSRTDLNTIGMNLKQILYAQK